MHTGSNLSAPVWLHYPYRRGTDKKNGAVWLRSISLPCEPTDRIQKKLQIGNEANFVYKRGQSTFLYISSWLRGMSTSNMYLSLIGSTWIRSRVHANYFGSDPLCTPEKFWIRSKRERSPTTSFNILKCGVYQVSLSDHYLVYCVRKFNGAVAKGHKVIKTRKMKTCNEEAFRADVASIWWEQLLGETDNTDALVQHWSNLFSLIINKHVHFLKCAFL